MGCILSSPVELIRVQRHGSAAFRSAVAEMQGWRVHHEDAHQMVCDDSSAAFWVLDGHGGEGAAQFGAPELVEELRSTLSGGKVPEDERITQGFEAVDTRLREHIAANPEKDSGTTVVGALVARQSNGSYSLKMLNCGDSRGLVVRGPSEKEGSVETVPVRIPQHLVALSDNSEAVAKGDAPRNFEWPVIVESIDHKPNHPTEKSRIEAANGTVTEEEPPRLDGNLAVSRGLGDFEYKADAAKPASEQKVSCIPDVYEVNGLKDGTICILGCDGVWDVMSGDYVAGFVRDKINENADLGDIAAELIRQALRRNSRDNVTVMIAHFVDGSDWTSIPDEMMNHDRLDAAAEIDEEVRKHYLTFLRRCKFPGEPCPCAVCSRWTQNMNQCPCKTVFYCNRECQKKGWKAHKQYCTTTTTTPGAAPGSPSTMKNAKVPSKK